MEPDSLPADQQSEVYCNAAGECVGYVPPVIEVEPVIVDEAPSGTLFGSFSNSAAYGVELAGMLAPILALIAITHFAMRWINSYFAPPSAKNSEIIALRIVDAVILPSTVGTPSNNIVLAKSLPQETLPGESEGKRDTGV